MLAPDQLFTAEKRRGMEEFFVLPGRDILTDLDGKVPRLFASIRRAACGQPKDNAMQCVSTLAFVTRWSGESSEGSALFEM